MSIERSQTQKVTYFMIPFIHNVQNRQIYSARKHISDCQGMGAAGRRNWKWLLISTKVLLQWWQFSRIKKWWWLHNSMNMLRTPELYILKGWILWYENSTLIIIIIIMIKGQCRAKVPWILDLVNFQYFKIILGHGLPIKNILFGLPWWRSVWESAC